MSIQECYDKDIILLIDSQILANEDALELSTCMHVDDILFFMRNYYLFLLKLNS